MNKPIQEEIKDLKRQIKEKNTQLNVAQKTLSLLTKEYNQLTHQKNYQPTVKTNENEINKKYLEHLLLTSTELSYISEIRNKLIYINQVSANHMINLLECINQKKNLINFTKIKENNFLNELIEEYNQLISLVTVNPNKTNQVSELYIPDKLECKKYFMALKLVLNQLFYKGNVNIDISEDMCVVRECIRKMEEVLKSGSFDMKKCFEKLTVYDLL